MPAKNKINPNNFEAPILIFDYKIAAWGFGVLGRFKGTHARLSNQTFISHIYIMLQLLDAMLPGGGILFPHLSS